MPAGYRLDFFNFADLDVLAKGVIFKPSFERQGHRLSHASVRFAGWKSEVEVKIHRSWHFNHAAINYQHIRTDCGNLDSHIPRARHVTHHTSRPEVVRFD